jgi:Tfp pilus assembly protein PilF
MEKSLRQVIAKAPDNHHAYNALGYSLAERNVRLKEAHQLIDKALGMAPEDPFIMDSMGWVQYRLGNLDAAEAQLRRAYACAAIPRSPSTWAKCCGRRASRPTPSKLWREARAKDPKNDAAQHAGAPAPVAVK